jgi:hypothetical protein
MSWDIGVGKHMKTHIYQKTYKLIKYKQTGYDPHKLGYRLYHHLY